MRIVFFGIFCFFPTLLFVANDRDPCSCGFDLEIFCEINLPLASAVGYTTKDILYFWHDKEAVGIDKGVKLPQYEVRGKREREKLIMLSTGEF